MNPRPKNASHELRPHACASAHLSPIDLSPLKVLFLYGELVLMAALMAACGLGCTLWVVAFAPYTIANTDSLAAVAAAWTATSQAKRLIQGTTTAPLTTYAQA